VGCRLPDELINIIIAKSTLGIMVAAHVDFAEYVFEACMIPTFIDVVHTARDLEKGDHLLDIRINYQRVCLAGWFKYIVTFVCDPIMLEVPPAAFQNITMNWRRMTVTAQYTGTPHSEQIAP
jgi:hypothetical protein